MSQDSMAVALFDVGGQSLQLPADVWRSALVTAIAHGWRPAGTAPPPRRWGLGGRNAASSPWDGRYEEPLGQCVTAADAREFALALCRATAGGTGANTVALVTFSARGSFIVCPLTAELDRALKAIGAGEAPDQNAVSMERLMRQLDQFEAKPRTEAAPERTPERA